MRIVAALLLTCLLGSVALAGRRDLQMKTAENSHSVRDTQPLAIGGGPKTGGAIGGDNHVPNNPDDQENGAPLPQQGGNQHMKKADPPQSQDQKQPQHQNENNGQFQGFTKRAPGQTFEETQHPAEHPQGGKDVVKLGDNAEALDKILNHPPPFKGFAARQGCSLSDGSWNRAGLLARSVTPPAYTGSTCPFLAVR